MSRLPHRTAFAAASAALVLTTVTACGGDAPSVSPPDSASAATSATPSSASETSASSSESSSSSSTSESSSSAPSPASSSVAGTRSDLVKFCEAAGADSGKKACDSHSSSIAESNAVYCSAELPSSAKGTVKAQLYLDGTPVFETDTQRNAGVGGLYLNFSVGKLKLTGGKYTCKFTAGSDSWLAETTVSGPKGRANQGMACDASTMYSKDNITHCIKNTDTLSDPSGLGCSALITDLQNRKVDATLHTPVGSKDVPLSTKFELGAAVVHLKAPKSGFGSSFPSGDYRCEFKVDGTAVITVPFTVS